MEDVLTIAFHEHFSILLSPAVQLDTEIALTLSGFELRASSESFQLLILTESQTACNQLVCVRCGSASRCTYSFPSLTPAQIKYGGRRKTSGSSCGTVERFCVQMWTRSSADLRWRIIGVVMTGDLKASNGRVKLSGWDERRLHNTNSWS